MPMSIGQTRTRANVSCLRSSLISFVAEHAIKGAEKTATGILESSFFVNLVPVYSAHVENDVSDTPCSGSVMALFQNY